MRTFMDEEFLLTTDTARELYHDAAEAMPILDYHCHLNPAEIAANQPFRNIGHLLLGGDHYKWRLMLSAGVDEAMIRGDADEYDKFLAYARALRGAPGNPLYHWTHLELKRVFGIDDPLDETTAPAIWEMTGELLARDEFRPQGLIDRFHVDTLCTTDDPADSLEHHETIVAQGTLKARVLPAYRPDKAINVERAGFAEYIARLAAAADMDIHCTKDVLTALGKRAEFFHALGARLSDHALDTVQYTAPDLGKADKAFKCAMEGDLPEKKHITHYKSYLLEGLGAIYTNLGWTQQYHVGAMRNNNAAMFAQYGADVGFDSIDDRPFAAELSHLMNAQNRRGHLPRTILYTLNPAANAAVAAMLGNFQQSGVRGKIQMGSAWWFNDHLDGMREQLCSLASMGYLSAFVGMLTDSRSFVSYPRHEYFRRILCELLGGWVERGEYPNDMEYLKKMVRGICFENAKAYFAF